MSMRRVTSPAARPALLMTVLVTPLALLLGACAGGDETARDTTPSVSETPTETPTDSTTPEDDGFAPTDYSFTVVRTCFCADAGIPIRVTVVDDEVTSAVYARSSGGRSGAVKGAEVPGGAPTIDEIIALARTTDAYRVEVEWPEGQDHPDSVYVDRAKNMMDEEIGYAVSDVVVG